MNKPNCCEKCKELAMGDPRIPVCTNVACSCHTALAAHPTVIESALREFKSIGHHTEEGFYIPDLDDAFDFLRTFATSLLREARGKTGKDNLIEASFPGSPYTLDWKVGYNAALSAISERWDREYSETKV